MPRRAEIGGNLSLNSRDAHKALTEFKRNAEMTAGQISKIKVKYGVPEAETGRMSRYGEGVRQWGTQMRDSYRSVAAGAASAAAALVAIDRVSVNLKTFDDMVDKMTAVTGSAEEARSQVMFLKQVGFQQDLELKPLVLAHERLMTLGYDAQRSLQFVRELANALEFSGGEPEELLRVVESLDKMGQKADVSVKALTAMGERMPLLRKILAEEFGGGTAAELAALGMSAEELFAGIERGLKRLPTARAGKAERGVWGNITDAGATLVDMGANLAGTDAGALGIGDAIPSRVPAAAESAEARARRLAEMEAAAARKRVDAAREEMAVAQEIAAVESALRIAREEGGAKEIARLEDKLDILREAAALAEKYRMSEEQAAALIKESNAERRGLEAAEKGRTQGRELSAARQAMAVETLRARGQNKAADRLEKEAFLRDEAARWEKMGLTPEDARGMAEQGQRNKEDAEHFARTGRRRIRGAVSRNYRTGIDGESHTGAFDFEGFNSANNGAPGVHSAIPGFDGAVRGTPRTDAGKTFAAENARLKRGMEQLQRTQGHGPEAGAQLNALKEIKSELSRLSGIMLKKHGREG